MFCNAFFDDVKKRFLQLFYNTLPRHWTVQMLSFLCFTAVLQWFSKSVKNSILQNSCKTITFFRWRVRHAIHSTKTEVLRTQVRQTRVRVPLLGKKRSRLERGAGGTHRMSENVAFERFKRRPLARGKVQEPTV